MSKEGKFVPLATYIEKGQAWDKADESEAPKKSGSVWGKVEEVKPVSLASVQVEEARKENAIKEKQQNDDRQPGGTYKPSRGRDNGAGFGGRDNFGTGNFGTASIGGIGGGSGSIGGYGGSSGGYGGSSGGYGGSSGGYGGSSGGYGGSSGGSSGGYGGSSGGYGGRRDQPREKTPIPNSPPFTAYVGNLPYENADEGFLGDFFGELGIVDIRIAMDPQTDRPKGYAYIQFQDRLGLERALEADGAECGSRKLLVDVASTRDRAGDDRGRWGTRDGSSASGFGVRRDQPESRFDGDGPSNWRAQKEFVPTHTPSAPSGPPRLGLQPRTKPLEEVGRGPVRRTGEDPFGGATSDAEKLKKVAEERLRREQESERKTKEQLQKVQQQREQREQAAAQPKDSWRGARQENNQESRGPRRGKQFDSSWGPSARSTGAPAASTAEQRPQRAPEQKKGPSRQEQEKAEALANPFSVLENQ